MENLKTGHWLADENGDVVHARLLPDVKLAVSGYTTVQEKLAAARWIAHCLNQFIQAMPADDAAPERMYLGRRGMKRKASPGDIEYVRADIAATLSQMTTRLAELINETAIKHQAERERILSALQAEAHIAVTEDECTGASLSQCFERGLRAGSNATREAIKAAVQKAMEG